MELFHILEKYMADFMIGLSVTLKMTGLIWLIGLSFGILLGIAASKFRVAIGIPVRILTFLLGSIPVLVFLYWLHYPLQKMLDIVVDGYFTTIATLSIINIFLVASIVSSALDSFPKQYILSGQVCGFSTGEIISKIQIPLIVRQILPGILVVQVIMMHSTLFGSLISVDELFRISQRVNSEVYKPVEVYSTLAIFFLVISTPITGLAYWFNRRYTTKLSKF